jgi:hypothetical protein
MNFDHYNKPVAMSDPGAHAALFEDLPHDVRALAKIAQEGAQSRLSRIPAFPRASRGI